MRTVTNHFHFFVAGGGVGTRIAYIRDGIQMSASFPEQLTAEQAIALVDRLNRALTPK